MPASRAFFTVGTIAVEIARHKQNALGAGRDQLLDRSDFTVIVAVELAGIRLRSQSDLFGLGLKAFFHFDKEGIGVGFRDEPNDFAGMDRPAH